MTAKGALKKIFALPRTNGTPSKEPMRKLMRELRNPQDSLRYIHIAGTNGKGSTATMIASVLQAAGLCVGLYTSPYINDFRERFRINGLPVSVAAFENAARRCFDVISRMKDGNRLSQFDVVTAIGFLLFVDAECDIVVLECGLGGRFDATNIISPPLVSVICNIGFDHTELLGDTIEKIAAEKCGILKDGTEAFIMAPQDYPDAVKVMDGYAAEHALPTTRVSRNDIVVEECSFGGLHFSYKGHSYTCSLAAAYQANNAATAIEAIEALRHFFPISDSALAYGLSHAYIPARLELMALRPYILLDGAHNADGIRALLASVKRLLPQVPHIFCLVGMLEGKDPAGALEAFFSDPEIREKLCGVVTVTPDSPRACPAEKLSDIISSFGLPEEVHILPFQDTRGGLYAIMRDLRADEALFCFGSLYMMGDLRRYIKEYYMENKGAHRP